MSRNRSQSQKDDSKSGNRGGAYLHKDSRSARNKKCNSCGKLNHFARVYRTNPHESAKHVTHEDTEDDGYVYTTGRDKQPTCRVKINGNQVEWCSIPAHRSILWTKAPSGNYTKGRYHKPLSSEFSPADDRHLYLCWELLRPKYSLTPTTHGRPSISVSKVL